MSSINKSDIIAKYGNLWYLREFDYLPSQLKYYGNINKDFINHIYGKDKLFDLFETKEQAEKASDEIRRLRGLI